MIETRTMLRCALLMVLMLGTVAACRFFPNAATDPQTGMWLRLPESVPGHLVESIEPDKQELKWLPEDTGILKRLYKPYDAVSDYQGLYVTLILSGNDPRSLHKPEVCLDGQGWRIVKKEPVELEVNGKPLEVMDFTLKRDQKTEDGEVVSIKAHYVYWWIGKTRSTANDWERIIYSDLDNLFRNINNRWGYPSVMVYVDPAKGDGEAQERAYDFIRNHASVFQKSLAESSAASESAPAP